MDMRPETEKAFYFVGEDVYPITNDFDLEEGTLRNPTSPNNNIMPLFIAPNFKMVEMLFPENSCLSRTASKYAVQSLKPDDDLDNDSDGSPDWDALFTRQQGEAGFEDQDDEMPERESSQDSMIVVAQRAVKTESE